MKKEILIALFMFVCISFKGYSQDSTRTLFHLSIPNTIGLYVAPEFQYGQFKGPFTSFAGGSAMLLFNKKFAIGVSMQHNVYLSYSPSGISPLVLTGGFGGLKMEYTCNPDAAVHLSFPLLIGMGRARADSATYVYDRWNDTLSNQKGQNYDYGRRGIRNEAFIIQPGIQVEANVLSFVKLFAGANYRFALATYSSSNNTIVPANSLQGLSLNIGLKAGIFDFKISRKKI
jgi:hypothetical protein